MDEAGESESKVVPQGRGKAGVSLYRLNLGEPKTIKQQKELVNLGEGLEV